jgi:NAD(P)-dependent dehydrogenase (short-subunit alcohol dehydrogenase family)
MTTHIIVGATGGIGRAVSARLAERGASLVLSGRDGSALSALAADLPGRPLTMAADATDADAIDEVFAGAAEHGPISGVAHCVGSLLLKPAHITSPIEFSDILDTNLTSAFNVVRAATKQMIRTGGGSIVLVSSAAASAGLANHEAIAAAKAGIEGLTRAAAASYAAKGIRVNAVAPGMTQTPLAEGILSNPAAMEASVAMHALGRLGRPSDVAAAIVYLLSEDASWVTGQVLGVDGGLARLRSRR